ncbi:MAG: undecaprenyldiphospho-muramoylpentapeptide beta-N-acetylglucosaminyltransferase [Proteobacteria bacterium]|nr:undecaprenyldiphospho-muramoylpentapeptide beta-N-acetylglucosaminyltransferase [Pseudomonadota bacterium]
MTDKKPSIVLASGGTGGHIFPAEALAQELKIRGFEPVLITDKRYEDYRGNLRNFEAYTIRTSTPSGSLVKKIGSVVDMGVGYMQALGMLRKIKPAVVVGFGGYPSFPTMFAATHLGIKTIIHEQNSLLGRANIVLAKKVQKIATSFAEVKGIEESDKKKVVFTGNPVRAAIRALRDAPYPELSEHSDFNILVTGGSQGATIFSTVIPEAIHKLPPALKARVRVDQQCRPADLEQAKKAYKDIGVDAYLTTFFNDMPERIAKAHLLIVRSGASTLAEITVAGRPAIMVPYPHAMDNHQAVNADTLEDAGAGWVMPQDAFTADALSTRIESFLNLPATLKEAAEKSRAAGEPEAAARLADMVEQMILPNTNGHNGNGHKEAA